MHIIWSYGFPITKQTGTNETLVKPSQADTKSTKTSQALKFYKKKQKKKPPNQKQKKQQKKTKTKKTHPPPKPHNHMKGASDCTK